MLDPSKSAGTASPVTEAQQYFPGHQEFFFIFILSTDCYSFSVHLKNRLKAEIIKLVSSLDTTKGVEKRLLHLMLLSKFLGLLIFSPSWHDSGIVGGARYDLLSEFNPDLDVFGMVEQAYLKRQLVVTVPWVVEFLRMARWSPTLQRSHNFERLLGLVLGIRRRIQYLEKYACSVSLCMNMQLVSFYFETLFGDVVGLERMSTIPAAELAKSKINGETIQPDELQLCMSNTVLFTCNPHAEELVTLLSSQGQSNTKSSGSSRKLTPYSVGSSFGSSTDPLGSKSAASVSPMKTKRRDSLGENSGSLAQVDGTDEQSPIIGKLVEAFFHQHRDLKEICEFIVDQTLKNAASRMRDECVVPLLVEKIGSGTNTTFSSTLKKQVVEASRTFLANELGNSIPNALESLCPPTVQPKVRDVASKLTVSHAIRLGEATIDPLVQLESKKLSLERARQLKKRSSPLNEASEETSRIEAESQQNATAELEDALVRLRNGLSSRLWERRPDDMKIIVEIAIEQLSGSHNGGTASLYGLSRAFELSSVQLLMWCLDVNGGESSVRWCTTAGYLRILAVFAGAGKTSAATSFVTKVTSFFSSQGPVDGLIDLSLDEAEDIEVVARLFLFLARAELMPSAILEMALIRALQCHEQGRNLCQLLISHVDESSEECNADSSVVFGRLRGELSRHGT